MTCRPAAFVIALIVAIAALSAAPAAAQNRGRPKTPKAGTTPTPAPTPTPTPNTTPTPAPAAPATPSSGAGSSPAAPAAATVTAPEIGAPFLPFRQFGTWLDDASAPAAGDGYVSFGIGHWRMPGISQTDVPMLGGGIGVTDRFQLNASVPFYRYNFEGTSASGIDDIYISGKYTIVDPTLTISEVGVAVTPLLEVLSADVGDRRVHFAVPVSVELRRLPFRVYGSAGYFTRGAFFGGGVVEWTAPSGVSLSGAITQSYSTQENPVLDGLAVSRQRVDVSGAAAFPVANTSVMYLSIGRSLRAPDGASSTLALMGGISFRFSAARSTP